MKTPLIIAALTLLINLPTFSAPLPLPPDRQRPINNAHIESIAAQRALIKAMADLRDTIAIVDNKENADAAAPGVSICGQRIISAATQTLQLAKQHPELRDGLNHSNIISDEELLGLEQQSLGKLIRIYIYEACYDSDSLRNATIPLLKFIIYANSIIFNNSIQSNTLPDLNTHNTPELQTYIELTRQVENSVKTLIARLETIENRASADAAAPDIITCAQQFRELNTRMNALPGPAETLCEAEKDILRDIMCDAETEIIPALTRSVRRIRESNYYHSEQLKEALEQWLSVGGRLCRS